MSKLTEEDIKKEALAIINLETEVANAEEQLMQNPDFRNFLAMQKEINAKAAKLWEQVKQHMIDSDIKSVKGDWGYLTIAESHEWITTNELPAKFYKKVVNTKLLTDTYKLTNKEPKGAHLSYKYSLRKGIK